MIGFTRKGKVKDRDEKVEAGIFDATNQLLADLIKTMDDNNRLLATSIGKLDAIKRSNDDFVTTITNFFSIERKRRDDADKQRAEREEENKPTEHDGRY